MRVATYNIHRCVGSDGRYDPERTAEVIRRLDADLVALQEVETLHRPGGDMLDRLATATAMAPIAGPVLFRADSEYGNAVLLRHAPTAIERIPLAVGGREPRGALGVHLECPGARLRCYATHLGLAPWERREQVERLSDAMDLDSADITILLGDINEWYLWGRPLRRLRRHLGPSPHRRSFPARLPLFALDRIWVTPPGHLRRLGTARGPLERIASDHLPVWAEIDCETSGRN